MNKMKTIDEVLNSWNAEYIADNPHNVDGYNKADVLAWLAQKQLLQQTPGTTTVCQHPTLERRYIGNNMLRCNLCGVEFK